MIKRFCDICGRNIVFGLKFVDDFKNYQFSISSNGRIWDVCQECRDDLWIWMKSRKNRPVCQEEKE